MSEQEPKKGHKVVVEFGNKKGKESAGEAEREAASAPAPAAGPGAEAAAEQIARLQAERDELTQTLVRRQADFENYKKRIERERDEEHRRGVGRLIEQLIQVMDSFDRALKAHGDPAYEEYRKGLEAIYRQLWDTLARHGLERIDASGKQFDPHWHQAIDRVESLDHPDGAIVEVLQDGYTFHGRVLRPSIVRVAVHPVRSVEDTPPSSSSSSARGSRN